MLCFITNRSYLTGKTFAGLRQWLRRDFDQIDILDLRGDSRGGRPAGIEFDENLFDIEVGIAIIIARSYANHSSTSLARVYYADAWSHCAFTREEKTALLREGVINPNHLTFVEIERDSLDDFRPRSFEGRGWPSIAECFKESALGMQTKRDDFCYDVVRERLIGRITSLHKLDATSAIQKFHPTGARPLNKILREQFDEGNVVKAAYRPFDGRFIYLAQSCIDRPRPNLHEIWSGERLLFGESGRQSRHGLNECVYAMPYKTGAGPAVVVHNLKPDYHSFRGSYGGYAFPLYDRRPASDGSNLDLRLVRALSERYNAKMAAEAVFDVIVALLSAPSYTRRFATDLEDSFPHVPFPGDVEVFRQGMRVGRRIRRLQTFDLQPEERFWTGRLEGSPKDRTLAVPKSSAFLDQGNGFGTIRLAGTLRLERVPVRVWEFAVSGYRVVYRWLEARNGLSLDEVIDEETRETIQRQLLDLIARVAAYVDACDAAEPILEAALASPLTKSDLKYTQAALV